MGVFSSAVLAGTFVLCLICLFWLVRLAARVSELQDTSSFLKASRVASLEERLTETEETLSGLANRVKMMRVRNAVTHTDKPNGGEPDPYRDPNAWRAAMNRRLAQGKLSGN